MCSRCGLLWMLHTPIECLQEIMSKMGHHTQSRNTQSKWMLMAPTSVLTFHWWRWDGRGWLWDPSLSVCSRHHLVWKHTVKSNSYFFTVKWHIARSYQSKPAARPSMRTLRSRPQSHGLSTATELSEYPQPETAHWRSLQSRCIPPVRHYCGHNTDLPNNDHSDFSTKSRDVGVTL